MAVDWRDDNEPSPGPLRLWVHWRMAAAAAIGAYAALFFVCNLRSTLPYLLYGKPPVALTVWNVLVYPAIAPFASLVGAAIFDDSWGWVVVTWTALLGGALAGRELRLELMEWRGARP